MIPPYTIRLFLALGLVTCSAFAETEKFPFVEGMMDNNNNPQPWTLDQVRRHRDDVIGDLTGKTSTMDKDSTANPNFIHVSKIEEEKKYETDLDLTDITGQVFIVIQADDHATLTIKEKPTGKEATGHAFIEQTYQLLGTALWRVDRAYKEFPNPILGGRTYNLKLHYRNTANLTKKYNGTIDYDGVNVFLISGGIDLKIAKYGDEPDLAEDQNANGINVPPPHEMNPGGVVFAPIMGADGKHINPDKRAKLTITPDLSQSEEGTYTLSADPALAKMMIYETKEGGEPIKLPKEWSAKEFKTGDKVLYVGSSSLDIKDEPLKGMLTLQYKRDLAGNAGEAIALKDQVIVNIISLGLIDMIGHRRGTLNKPGAISPVGTYGKETVLLENADRDEGSSTHRDVDTAALDHDKDDDLVKVVLSFPKNFKPSGIGLNLKHEGMKVNGEKKTFDSAVVREGASRLNFYDAQGNKLTDADLKIADLANPGNGYMAKILSDGTLTLFIEGADDFGSVGNDDTSQANAKLMGGALLTLEITGAEAISGPRLLVFRGGFFRYTHKSNQPGAVGTIEFFDGKGRITNTTEDLGKPIKTWKAKSGLPGGGHYSEPKKNGYTPPGWWLLYKRDDFDEPSQKNQQYGNGENLFVQQGSYCRWYQDDFAPHYTAFSTNTGKRKYLYQNKYEVDRKIGKPAMPKLTTPDGQTIMFKFQMSVIPPNKTKRTEIQIHPDGWKNGTSGCIGIQSYDHCKEAYRYLNDYRGMKIKVELN